MQVRINREYEEEDLGAIMVPGLDGVIPKPEWRKRFSASTGSSPLWKRKEASRREDLF